MSKGLGKLQRQLLSVLAERDHDRREPGQWYTGQPISETHKYGHTDAAKARCAECQKHNLTPWGTDSRLLAEEIFETLDATPSQHSAVRRALRGLVARGLAETRLCGIGYSRWSEYRSMSPPC